MTVYPIPDALQEELDHLNKAVEDAVEARTKWLDAHMSEVSKVQVGDEVYNLDTGCKVGVVSELYRYHAGQGDWRYDTSLDVDARFETSPRCFDNTSRQPFKIGTKEEAARRFEAKARALRPS